MSYPLRPLFTFFYCSNDLQTHIHLEPVSRWMPHFIILALLIKELFYKNNLCFGSMLRLILHIIKFIFLRSIDAFRYRGIYS